MSGDAWAATGTIIVVFALLAAGRWPPYLVLLGGLTVLLVGGVVDPAAALAGFSNTGIVTVGALFVVAAGLRQTNALAYFVQRALGRPRSAAGAQTRLALPVMAGSAFLNNTPVVAMLLPVILDWCKASRISPSKLLLPLSYLAILGGVCTLIGTSTSLVVNGLVIADGKPSLGLFDIAWVGVPCALAGLAFLLLVGRRLLPERASRVTVPEDPREYTVEMVVMPGGSLVGKPLEAVGLGHLPDISLMEVHRDGGALSISSADEALQAGDQLVFTGLLDSVVDLQRFPGLRPATRQVLKLSAHRAERCFVEAVVSRMSPLVGQTIREGEFRTHYDAVVLAISRNGRRLVDRVEDVELRPGDALLLEAGPSFIERHRNSTDFSLVSRLEGQGPPTAAEAPVAVAILVAMIVSVTAGLLQMVQAAFVAAAAMLLTRCCSEDTARKSIDWPLLLAIGAAFGLGRGLEETGAAATLAQGLLRHAGTDPWLALVMVYGTATILSELVTNNAAAVIVFPIAMATAGELDVSYVPFVIALMIAASASFATPIGYQTNLMVYGPGGYRFSDFIKVGVPMKLILWAVTVSVTPLFWEF